MTTSRPPFERILIANRGEIAVRIIRAVHDLGAIAVSVYSDPDESAPHVKLSDETYRIGPGPATESYLNVEAIVEAARESRAEAVHPGYGFLSENAAFAAAVQEAGLKFIGPPPEVIRLMGDKVAAKRLVEARGVSVLPGYDDDDQQDETLAREAKRIGYPIMLKAAAGGGGRGMRVVKRPVDIRAAIGGARREALAAFGDGRLFLEKLLISPRHIEVQVLGDEHGNLIHLYERDCSVQRRHQKVIEEAPSPALTDEERMAICRAGLRAAGAAGYRNAGTVEFLWENGKFYFLEMNTRIQVEHGVTELVTGIDLVRAQIEIAAGNPLPWRQEEIARAGHAIETRLYAEDPTRGFLPQFGRLTDFHLPEHQAGVRVDAALRCGMEISRYYDPLLAKLMVHGPSRPESLAGLVEALDKTRVDGVETNLEFLRWVASTDAFVNGEATTSLADQWPVRSELHESRLGDDWILACVGADVASEWAASTPRSSRPGRPGLGIDHDNRLDLANWTWSAFGGWRVGGQGIRLAYAVDGAVYRTEVCRRPDGRWWVAIDGRGAYDAVRFQQTPNGDLTVVRDHRVCTYGLRPAQDAVTIVSAEGADEIRVERAQLLPEPRIGEPEARPAADSKSGVIEAPMPGVVLRLHVHPGDQVTAQQPLLVLEAMKMEHVLEATNSGVVQSIAHQEGDLVSAGEPLMVIGEA